MAEYVGNTGRPAGAPFLSRRLMLGGSAASVAVPPPGMRSSPPPRPQTTRHSDAALLEACEHFDHLEAAIVARMAPTESQLPATEIEFLVERQRALVDIIVDHEASSLVGIQRRTQTLVSWADDLADLSGCCWDKRLVAATLRDVLAVTEVPFAQVTELRA